ncbi:response regulator transcription factor [Kutzneria sp. CA-103260]|uniref:response regulator transcription factor n=1 Tax=Kutzneria sp. CA-103260 TaxID=2802641 RepID=UPI001BABA2F2|nr:response regulator transcription factor [Kutzneria sp. CA-103260]QUQ63087.1 two-component system response regulator [Kutzneria sp. CA-103260]
MGETQTVGILIADDHTLLREAMRDVLLAEDDFRVVGEAADGESVVEVAARTQPDVVLLDVEMPRHHPVNTVQELLAASPRTRVIVLSMYDDPRLVKELLETGICGYLHKSVSRRDLVAAIRSACGDLKRVTVLVSQGAFSQAPVTTGGLSYREQEVLTLVASAMSNRQIAGKLCITEGTVKRHLRNIFGKLDAVSRIDAVNKAVSASIIRSVR